MGLKEVASGNSLWRGYEYYKAGKVKSFEVVSEDVITGVVSGSDSNEYDVRIDIVHAKKSTCDCPHAEGTRRVCKHKIALFFTAFPQEAEAYIKEFEEYEKEEEQRRKEEQEELWKYIKSLSKA